MNAVAHFLDRRAARSVVSGVRPSFVMAAALLGELLGFFAVYAIARLSGTAAPASPLFFYYLAWACYSLMFVAVLIFFRLLRERSRKDVLKALQPGVIYFSDLSSAAGGKGAPVIDELLNTTAVGEEHQLSMRQPDPVRRLVFVADRLLWLVIWIAPSVVVIISGRKIDIPFSPYWIYCLIAIVLWAKLSGVVALGGSSALVSPGGIRLFSIWREKHIAWENVSAILVVRKMSGVLLVYDGASLEAAGFALGAEREIIGSWLAWRGPGRP